LDLGPWTAAIGRLDRFLKISSANTARADFRLADPSVLPYPYGLKVGKKSSLGLVVGVADIIAYRRFFSTNVAGTRHEILLNSSELACGKSLGLLT
jgi:hypothetical protein